MALTITDVPVKHKNLTFKKKGVSFSKSKTFALHRQRILALLFARGPQGATTAEISSPSIGGEEGPRRIRELRDNLKHPIHGRRLPNGYWLYWLQNGKQPNCECKHCR